MRAQGVTHVHCHFATHPALAGFVIRRLTGIPFSFTAHGSDLHVERRMLPEKVAEAAFVATVSELNRELIIDECAGRFGEKVHIVRAGVDTSAFSVARNGDRPPPAGRCGSSASARCTRSRARPTSSRPAACSPSAGSRSGAASSATGGPRRAAGADRRGRPGGPR